MVLICISLVISDIELLFDVPVGHLYVFFGKMSLQVFSPFSYQVISSSAIELYKFLSYFRNM